MAHEAKLTQAVRLRSQKTGAWLIAPAAGSVKKGRRIKSGSFSGQTAAHVSMMPEIQEFITAPYIESSAEEVLLIAADDPAILKRMQEFFVLLEDRLEDFEEAEMQLLIDVAMPTLSERPPPEAIEQARRNVQARKAFLRDYEVLEAEQVHALYGSRAKNKSALAARWRAEGKIFAVEHESSLLYPAFQFDSQGRPRPVVADILSILAAKLSGWQLALWFVSSNGWLDGASPLDLLDDDPERVLDAAKDIVEPAIF